jgi:RHS repeat-associated protein
VVAQYSAGGQRQYWYTQSLARIDEVLNVVSDGGKQWYQADALGSIYDLTNSSGVLIGNQNYDVFGAPTPAPSGPAGQPFGFTGREHELDSGLVYARARYLNPAVGAWTQPDRLGMIDGPNRFGYVAQRPTVLIDPSGNFFVAPTLVAALIGGLFAGFTGYVGGLRGWALVENIAVGATTAALGSILPPFPRGSIELAGLIAGAAVGALSNALGQLISIVNGQAQGFDRKAFVLAVVSGAVSGLLGGAFQPGSRIYQSLVRSVTGTIEEQWQFMMTSAFLGGIAGGMFDSVITYIQRQAAMEAELFGDGADQLMCLPKGSR